MKPTRAIIYCRFSPRPNAASCESNATQEEYCRRYCAEKGWEVAQVFSDEAMSGGNTDRDGLWAAIEFLKRGDVLVVQYLDRLARDVGDSLYIEKEVLAKGAKIVSAAGEGTWSDTPTDRFLRTVLQAKAQLDKELQAERTAAAMRRHQRSGRRMSDTLPYGFRAGADRMVPDDKGGMKAQRMIEVDPEEQAISERIVLMEAGGLGLRAIGRRLTKDGAKCRGNGWHHGTIKSILERAKGGA